MHVLHFTTNPYLLLLTPCSQATYYCEKYEDGKHSVNLLCKCPPDQTDTPHHGVDTGLLFFTVPAWQAHALSFVLI